MRLQGRIEIGPFGGTSKSARRHQAFLVTEDGERLQLRRYDGPTMRDATLEQMAGQDVVADGLRRDRLFIAVALKPASAPPTAPSPGRSPSASGGKAKRKP
jgi:hypothetical protein